MARGDSVDISASLSVLRSSVTGQASSVPRIIGTDAYRAALPWQSWAAWALRKWPRRAEDAHQRNAAVAFHCHQPAAGQPDSAIVIVIAIH